MRSPDPPCHRRRPGDEGEDKGEAARPKGSREEFQTAHANADRESTKTKTKRSCHEVGAGKGARDSRQEKTRLNKVWRASNDKIEGEQELTAAKQDRADSDTRAAFFFLQFLENKGNNPTSAPEPTYFACSPTGSLSDALFFF
jgi:hypothetical protein